MDNWKTIPKIDAHIHLMPPDVIEANQGFNDKFVDYGSVNDYLKLMDKYHIDSAFLMPFNDPYMLSMDFTVEAVNNNMTAMCKEGNADHKLYYFADIDLRNEMDKTIYELDRVTKQKECLGIKSTHPILAPQWTGSIMIIFLTGQIKMPF